MHLYFQDCFQFLSVMGNPFTFSKNKRIDESAFSNKREPYIGMEWRGCIINGEVMLLHVCTVEFCINRLSVSVQTLN